MREKIERAVWQLSRVEMRMGNAAINKTQNEYRKEAYNISGDIDRSPIQAEIVLSSHAAYFARWH